MSLLSPFGAVLVASVRQRESLLVADRFDGWQVLRLDANDVRVELLAQQRMLHLQLVHERSGVSFVTPSRLTDGAIEISANDGSVIRVSCYGELVTVLAELYGIRAPSLHRLAAAVRWFLVPEIRKQLSKGEPLAGRGEKGM